MARDSERDRARSEQDAEVFERRNQRAIRLRGDSRGNVPRDLTLRAIEAKHRLRPPRREDDDPGAAPPGDVDIVGGVGRVTAITPRSDVPRDGPRRLLLIEGDDVDGAILRLRLARDEMPDLVCPTTAMDFNRLMRTFYVSTIGRGIWTRRLP